MEDNRNNTLATVLHEIFRKDKNLLNFLEINQTLLTGETDTVDITFTKTDGSEEVYPVASIGALIQRVTNAEENIKELTNVDNISSATIRLGDGSIRSIIVGEQFKEPNVFSVPEISSYSVKENSLKHLLVSPLTHAKISIPRTDYPSYDKCLINKVVLNLDDDDKIALFDGSIKNKQLEYQELVNLTVRNNISVVETEIEKTITASKFANVGSFDITQIKPKVEAINGTPDSDISVVYKLNTLFYKNVEDDTDIYLQDGDKVLVGENTTYEINFVDRSTKYVGFVLIKGYEPITTGVDVLKFFGNIEDPYIEAPIDKNEYVTFFIKPINSALSIASNDWGTGFSIYTEDLLADENVKNLWASVEAVSNENLVSASEFVVPNKPVLADTNFKIVIVNKHKAGKDTLDNLKNKFSIKKTIESNLKMVQDNITNTEKAINTTPSDDNFKKNKLTKELSALKEKLGSHTKELASSVNELNAVATDFKDYKPKYQIQGFITKGEDVAVKGVIQSVIGYDTEYRYLNKDEDKSENDSFSIEQDGVTKKSVIPKWLKMPNPKIREKDNEGNWLDDDDANVDKFNINQVTVTISANEKVEIRTRAISEAGYPLNLNYSEWSEPVVIDFPDEIIDDTESILEQSKSDIIHNRLFESLAAKGIDIHNLDSATIGEFYYAHFLRNIGTDELTPENKPIDAQTLINTLRDRITQLETTISGAGGTIKVRLLTEDEDVVSDVQNNGTVKVLDFYKNIIENNTVKKGSIVEKLFYIEITNVGEGNIELFPYVTGIKEDKLISNYTGYAFNLDEYNQFRQPYLAPLLRLNTVEDSDFLASKQLPNPYIETPAFQSSQVKGQILLSRAKDITLNNDLWIDNPAGAILPIFSVVDPKAFIWDGTQTIGTPNGNGGHTDFCVHTDHPSLESTSDFMTNFGDYYSSGALQTLPRNTVTPATVFYPEFIQNLVNSDVNSEAQLSYLDYVTHTTGSATIANFPRKAKYSEFDRYLIGSNTCGLYVSLALSDDSIFSDTNFVNEGLTVENSKRILIPILISSRLTDYFGAGSTGIENIGGVLNATIVKYTKKIGIDILVKENKLELQKSLSFDFSYTSQYQKSSVN